MAYFNPSVELSVYLTTKINVKEGMACYSLCLVCDIESNGEGCWERKCKFWGVAQHCHEYRRDKVM